MKAAKAVIKKIDSDGIPPGMDVDEIPLMGQIATVTFTGAWYAAGGKFVTFARKARIVYILRKTIVLQDLESKNIYVIERETGISQGCLMNTTVEVDGQELANAA